MACVVLVFRGVWWVSLLGSPSLLLGPVLRANPAGFACPAQQIQ